MGDAHEKRRWPCVPDIHNIQRCDVATVRSNTGELLSYRVFVDGKEVPKLEPKPVDIILPRLAPADLTAEAMSRLHGEDWRSRI